MNYLTAAPLLIVPLIAYLIFSVGGTGWIEYRLFGQFTAGDVFVWCSLALLFVETVKATATGSLSIINHVLSILVFMAALALAITDPNFATYPFVTFTAFALFDTVAGFVITIVSARRDFDGGAVVR